MSVLCCCIYGFLFYACIITSYIKTSWKHLDRIFFFFFKKKDPIQIFPSHLFPLHLMWISQFHHELCFIRSNPINSVFAWISLRMTLFPLRRSSSLSKGLLPHFYLSIVLEWKCHSSRGSLVHNRGRDVLLHLLGFRSNLRHNVPTKVLLRVEKKIMNRICPLFLKHEVFCLFDVV